MEIQELALKVLVCQIRYDLVPRFPDVRGALIERFSAEFDLPHWGWNDEIVNVRTEDGSVQLVAGGREMRAQFEKIEDARAAIDIANRFFTDAATELGVANVRFVGTRTQWAAAVDSFEELRNWLVEHLASPTALELTGEVGTHVSDVGWVFEFMDADPKHRMAIGPMTQAQFVDRVIPGGSTDDVPDAFLFLDFDRFYNDIESTPAEALERWRAATDRNLEIASGIGTRLTGESGIS